jgi:hypothetical protein
MTRIKNIFNVLFIIVVIFIVRSESMIAQNNSATASANVEATIIDAGIGLNENVPLNFGQLTPGESMGSVILDPSGKRTATGGVTLGMKTIFSPAEFKVTGTPNQHCQISIFPSKTIEILKLQITGNPAMRVDLVTSLGDSGQGLLDQTGSLTFNVGGTLHVASFQDFGKYGAEFEVTAENQ